MKSAQINRYGRSEVIEINQNTPLLNLSSEKILVDVKAAGVNPIDWKISEGYMKQMISLQFPSTLGMDFSGIIKEVSKDISTEEYKQGDEVYGQASVTNGGTGAFAEIALTNTDNVALKPKSLNYAEAAALPLVGVSAWQALVENMELSKDQKILIHGGAGGIGSIAIPLAKNLDAYVATTASSDDKEFVQNLGADEVIDYKSQDFEELVHDYDAVYDTVGGQTYTKSFKVLKKCGIIVSMLEPPNSDLMEKFGVKAIFQLTQVNKDRLTQLAKWIDKNNIKIHVDKTFSLDETAKALDYVKDVHPRGKVIIKI
jgi:NADPH:quinone reductase-like Zn-dependent oxidoreductase